MKIQWKYHVCVNTYSKIQTHTIRYHVFVHKFCKIQTNTIHVFVYKFGTIQTVQCRYTEIVQNICKTTNRKGNTKTVCIHAICIHRQSKIIQCYKTDCTIATEVCSVCDTCGHLRLPPEEGGGMCEGGEGSNWDNSRGRGFRLTHCNLQYIIIGGWSIANPW